MYTKFERTFPIWNTCNPQYSYIAYINGKDDDDVIFDISLYFLHVNRDWMNSRSISLCACVRTPCVCVYVYVCVFAHTRAPCVQLHIHTLRSIHFTSPFVCVWYDICTSPRKSVWFALSNWIRSHTVLVRFGTKTEVNVVQSVSVFISFNFISLQIVIIIILVFGTHLSLPTKQIIFCNFQDSTKCSYETECIAHTQIIRTTVCPLSSNHSFSFFYTKLHSSFDKFTIMWRF